MMLNHPFRLIAVCALLWGSFEYQAFPDEPLRPCTATDEAGTYCLIPLEAIHPTQFAVGMRTVREKQAEIAERKARPKSLDKFLRKKPEPVVIGPRGKFYIIDHHHLARALLEEDVPVTHAEVIANLSTLDEESFWNEMNWRHWVFPYDENGKGPLPFEQLPARVSELKDDPYRSLAGAVRDQGGYEKTEVYFAEFRWAGFFRTRVIIEPGDEGFQKAVQEALKLAHSPEARDLPGYTR